MMKIFTKFLIMIALPMQLCAQSLSPSVIASAGDFFSNSSGSLSFTVAEMSMVQTFTATNNVLTQGFQQPDSLSNTGIETLFGNLKVSIYPNPASRFVKIVFAETPSKPVTLNIVNAMGEVLKTINLVDMTTEIALGEFVPGLYLLQFKNSLTTYSLTIVKP